jgi:hypothetical protein
MVGKIPVDVIFGFSLPELLKNEYNSPDNKSIADQYNYTVNWLLCMWVFAGTV